MKFMTGATLKNMPSYLADDRQRLIMRREDEQRQKAEKEKEAFMSFSVDLLRLGGQVKDPDELNQKMGELASKYRSVLPPEAMAHAAQYVNNWAENYQKGQERQEKKLLETRKQADNQGLVNAIRGTSAGSKEYEVPMTDDDYYQSLSPEGQMRLLDYQKKAEAAEAKAALDAEDRLLKNNLTKARTKNLLNKPEDNLSIPEKKHLKDQAEADLMAGLPALGVKTEVDLDGNKAFYVPVDEQGNPPSNILQTIDRSGFKFTISDSDAIEEDGQKFIRLRLGSHDPKRMDPDRQYEEPASGTTDYKAIAGVIVQNISEGNIDSTVQAIKETDYEDMVKIYKEMTPEERRIVREALKNTEEPSMEGADLFGPRIEKPQESDRLGPAKDVWGALTESLKPVGNRITDITKKAQSR